MVQMDFLLEKNFSTCKQDLDVSISGLRTHSRLNESSAEGVRVFVLENC